MHVNETRDLGKIAHYTQYVLTVKKMYTINQFTFCYKNKDVIDDDESPTDFVHSLIWFFYAIPA